MAASRREKASGVLSVCQNMTPNDLALARFLGKADRSPVKARSTVWTAFVPPGPPSGQGQFVCRLVTHHEAHVAR